MNPQGTGRDLGQRHQTRTSEQREQNLVPTVAFDYAFMSRSDEDDERLRPILVMKDERTQMVAATFVDSKGGNPLCCEVCSSVFEEPRLPQGSA